MHSVNSFQNNSNQLIPPEKPVSSHINQNSVFPNVFAQSWSGQLPSSWYRRRGTDRPSTPARVRHLSGSRRLSLYENSSEEDVIGDERLQLGLKSSLKVRSVNGRRDEHTKRKEKLWTSSSQNSLYKTSLKSVNLEIPLESFSNEEIPRKLSLSTPDDSSYDFCIDININTRTSCSGVPLKKKKDNFVEADTNQKRRKSLPTAVKNKRNSLPNLHFLKNLFNRSSDHIEVIKEKKNPTDQQRRQSLPESKLKEQAFSKFGFRTRKTSSSSQSSSSYSPSLTNKLHVWKVPKEITCLK